MAESTNSGGAPGQPRKEMSMEIRLLLAFLLMGAVMFLTPYFFPKATAPPAAKKTAQTAPVAQTPPAPPPSPAAAVEAP
ncbi:MAG: hypothetical protein LAQ30_13500, partial [Acidobacteriia bacterium]|nr:hypothetical protein [Terriglobia bacterium]